jgi:TP901 family phage tail tape measure protein
VIENIDIRYTLSVVDRGSRKAVTADQQVRKSVNDTSQAIRRATQDTVRGSRDTMQAIQQQTRAHVAGGREATRHARMLGHVNREQRQVASSARAANGAIRDTAGTAGRAASGLGRMAQGWERVRAQASQAYQQLRRTNAEAARTSRSAGAGGGLLGAGAARGAGVPLAGIAATAGAAVGVGAFTTAGVGFEKTMARVRAVTQSTVGQMDTLDRLALKLGADTQYSAQQVADSMVVMGQAGLDARKIVQSIPGVLSMAAATGEDLAFSADAVLASIRGFRLPMSEATHVSDVFTTALNTSALTMTDLADTMKYVGPVAGSLGASLEDVAGTAAILGNVGIVGSQAGTTLRRMFVQLVRPSQRTMKLLDDVGISAQEMGEAVNDSATGKMRAMPEILGRLYQHINPLEGPAKRRVLAQLFGVEALPGALTLFDKGEKQINAVAKAMRDSDGTAERSAKIMRNTVSGAWDQFTGSVETAAISLTRRYNPALKGALQGSAGLVNRFVRGLTGQAEDDLATRQRRTVGSRVAARHAGEDPAVVGKQAAGMTMAARAGDILRKALGGVRDYASQLWAAMKPAQPFFQNVLIPLFKGFGTAVLASVVGAFKILIPTVNIVARVLGFLGEHAKPLKPVFMGIGVVLGFLLTGPILKGVSLIPKLGKVLGLVVAPARLVIGVIGSVGRVFGRVFGSLAGIVGGAVGRVVGWVGGKLIGGIRGALSRLGGVVSSPFRTAFGLAERVVRGYIKVFTTVGGLIVKGLVGAFKGIGGKIIGAMGSAVDMGKQIANGVIRLLNQAMPDKLSIPGAPDINLPDNPIPSFVRGGYVPGDPRKDGTLALLAGNEFVVTGGGQRMLENMAPGIMQYLAANQPPHFAKGGFVGGRQPGLLPGAYYSGYQAGIDPLSKEDILPDLRTSVASFTPKQAVTGRGSRGGRAGASAAANSAYDLAMAEARRINDLRLNYVYGGGHVTPAPANGPFDCSSAVSRVLQAANLGNPTLSSAGFMGWGEAGKGARITVMTRGAGRQGHAYLVLGGRAWGTSRQNPGGGPGWVFGQGYPWRSGFTARHPPGMRRGGFLPRFQAGGPVGARLQAYAHAAGTSGTDRAAVAQVQHALGQVQAIAGRAGNAALEGVRDYIQRSVNQLRKGGITGKERTSINRLRAALSLVEYEMGRRIGTMVRGVEQQADAITRRRTTMERGLRRSDIDQATSQGQTALRDYTRALVGSLKRQAATLRKALARALKFGDAQVIADVRNRLRDNADALDEANTQLIEYNRGITDALKEEQQAAADAAAETERVAREAAEQAAADAKQAAEDARQAILDTAQSIVDVAQHGTTLQELGLQRLELEQRRDRITGQQAFDQRKSYIEGNIIPAMQQQVAALQQQLSTAHQQGDPALARQVAEAIAATQNGILQQQVELQEQANELAEEANSLLQQFGGSVSFQYGGGMWTDALLASGVGA